MEVFCWCPPIRPRGVIVFSHGALSAPWKYERLIAPWAASGYEVLAPLHVDSADHPDTKNYPGFKSWRARIEDMRAVSAHIGRRYVAAGHSYGALVALTLGGASAAIPEGLSGPLRDERVDLALAFSPPGPIEGLVSRAGYATLAVPALIQTGTRDVPPGAVDDAGWRTHLAAYEAAASGGDRFALVLQDVDHYFGGAICRPELPGPMQLAQLDVASDLSRLFLESFGRGERRAGVALKARLSEHGPVRLSRK